MMHNREWLPNLLRGRARIGLAWVLAGLLPCAGTAYLGLRAADEAVTAEAAAEEATPDCDTPPPDPFPARNRDRHLARLGVDRWHAAGYRGRGVKVAVLDSGFQGYRSHLGTALPEHVTTRSFRSDGRLDARGSQHGILCGEVVHALAPEAELLLANWEANSPERFLEAVRWARQQGAKVITCSVIMPTWSDGEGGGPVNQGLARTLGSGKERADVLCFASAGNTAQRHWSGPFRDGGGRRHEWQPGETANALTPWMKGDVSVELYAHSGSKYEVAVTEAGSGVEVGRAASHQEGDRSFAVVHFAPQPLCKYDVAVRLADGPGGLFHVVALGGSLSCCTARGSIPFPADGPSVLAVAAVNGQGRRAAYSSCGPNSRQPKPDLSAPVPFPSLWRAKAFTGTSAAAPQAAALAALCWSRHPDWTADQVRRALRSAAADLGPPGHDCETGYGLVRLPGEDFYSLAH